MPKAKPTARRRWIALLTVLSVGGIAGLLWVFDNSVAPPSPGAPAALAEGETAAEAGFATTRPLAPTPDGPNQLAQIPSLDEAARTRLQALETQIGALQQQQGELETRLRAQADRIAEMQTTILALSPLALAPASAAMSDDALHEDLAELGALEQNGVWQLTIGEPQARFQPGQTDLPESLSPLIARIGQLLVAHPGVHAQIEVHTDNKGVATRNLELSQARARSVLSALLALGVAPDRLAADGFGGSRPLGDNRTVAARQRNRRIEIMLMTP
jgi:flagellar motor protein MotB